MIGLFDPYISPDFFREFEKSFTITKEIFVYAFCHPCEQDSWDGWWVANRSEFILPDRILKTWE